VGGRKNSLQRLCGDAGGGLAITQESESFLPESVEKPRGFGVNVHGLSLVLKRPAAPRLASLDWKGRARLLAPRRNTQQREIRLPAFCAEQCKKTAVLCPRAQPF